MLKFIQQILMNNKQRNKNISCNILSIVSNRLKPVNQSLHLCRTSCHTCLYKTKSQLNADEKPLSKIFGNKNTHNKSCTKLEKQKKESRLSLCSNLYQTIIYQQSWQKFKQQRLDLQKVKQEDKSSHQQKIETILSLNIIKSDTQSQTEQHMYSQQQVQKFIKDWMEYVIGLFSNLIFPTERDIMSLPFSSDKQLQNMRIQINCLADQHNSLYKDYFQCSTQINKSQFKKSMKTAASTSCSLAQTSELKWLNRSKNNLVSFEHDTPKEEDKDNSYIKLLDSSTTIPSQTNMTTKQQFSNNEQLYRMLLTQSSSIQFFLQGQ